MSEVIRKLKKYLTEITLIVALLLLPSYQLYNLEANVYDIQIKAKYLLSDWSLPNDVPEIALVLIDDEARRLDNSRRLINISTMSRSYLADLISKLKRIHPKVIALDFALDLPSEYPSEDEALAIALDSAKKAGIQIVIATQLVRTGRLLRPLLPLNEFNTYRTGYTNMLVSPVDQVIRQAEVALRVLEIQELARFDRHGLSDQLRYYQPCNEGASTGFCYWSFVSSIALAENYKDMKKRLHQCQLKGPFQIDFSIPPEKIFADYSSYQLLSGKLDSLLFGKIVLIGADYTESVDRHRTPLSVSSFPIGRFWAVNPVLETQLSGVKIQAYALYSLLNIVRESKGVYVIGELFLIIVSLVLSILILIVISSIRQEFWAIFIALFLPVVYVLAAFLLFQLNSIYLPIVRPVAAYIAVMGIAHYFKTLMKKGLNKEEN